MTAPLSTLASRALNAPSEAEYRGPSREFLIGQACLNVAAKALQGVPGRPDIPLFWHTYLSNGFEEYVRANWTVLRSHRDCVPARVIAEFNRLQAVHSFKDAGVGK